jgi:gliding motility-associated-like protein
MISTELFAQNLTLIGDAKLSLKEDGVVLSAPSVKLKDNSQIIQFESIKLTESGFIQLLSPSALLITKVLQNKEKAILPVGIESKTGVVIVNQSVPTSFSIGMDKLAESDALPFLWKITPNNSDAKEMPELAVDFSWEKEVEPISFSLKALVEKNQGDWDLLLEQQVQESESMISLNDYSDFDSEGSVFTVKNFTRDLDEDEVPDITEIGQVTDLNDPGKYLDTDGDGVPDYVEIQNETNPNDPVDFKDTEADGVPDYVGYRSPVSFLDLQDVSMAWGFQSYASLFQDSVKAMLGSGRLVTFPLNWDFEALNIYARGTYPITSELFELPSGVFNGYNMRAEVNGIVLPKASPLDFNLTNSNFKGGDKDFFIPIGAFVVTDPIDQIHEIKLNGSDYDNAYFEVKDNILYWSSADRVEGRTSFTVLLRLTDRDGNTLDKLFEIERERTELNEIEVYNTFTPNGDGTNDTWGVPEIRFFSGARVQVFERSGKRVFYTEDPDVSWDGTYQGKTLPVGTYYWVLELGETGESRKGFLNLIRN